jgi:hypothetical protein
MQGKRTETVGARRARLIDQRREAPGSAYEDLPRLGAIAQRWHVGNIDTRRSAVIPTYLAFALSWRQLASTRGHNK